MAAQTANLRDEASSIPHKEESDLKQYSEWRFDLDTNKNYFIKEASDTVEKSSKAPKIFAYYLPQFHAIPENDENYGKGFTEWTNVAAASLSVKITFATLSVLHGVVKHAIFAGVYR